MLQTVLLILLSFALQTSARKSNDHDPTPFSQTFEHRHLHRIENSGQILFADVNGDSLRFEGDDGGGDDDDSLFSIQTRPISVYRPVSYESFMHGRNRFAERLYATDRSDTNFVTEPNAIWYQDTLEAPNVTDRETLLNLAKMTRNAYLDINDDTSNEWYAIDGWNRTFPFGWEENADGLRGHVYVTADNKTAIIAIKGTSLTFLGGGGPTARRDKLNDNILFSCCCAAIDFTWIPVCPCSLSIFRNMCNQTCLEESLLDESLFYSIAVNLYHNVSAIYPNATIWTVGHSLGGALASLVALSFGVPSVTFESPGERMAAKRLRLPLPPSTKHVTHVYHTADPIAMGTCNGPFSICRFAGYAMETACHLGQTIIYDTITEMGWQVDVRTHSIQVIVERLLGQSGDDPVPEAKPQEDCIECYQWDYVSDTPM